MIELQDVSKIYPRRGEDPVVALEDISLRIESGEIHGIVGESGAGKSTLIRCLTALERPTSGSIFVDGKDLSSLPAGQLRDARRTIGMVFQGGNLLDQRTAAGNIAYPLRIAGQGKSLTRTRVTEMLELVGLADRARAFPSELSGGQRQRVGIARAMADRPSVLLCDEPTSALDSETTDQILDLLRDVRDTYGVTVLIITHEMEVVRKICSNVTLLDHGGISSTGKVSEIMEDVDSPLAHRIVPGPDFDPAAVPRSSVLVDVSFTARHGEPTGSRVLALASQYGADIGSGTFETLGEIQVARLALTIAEEDHSDLMAGLDRLGVSAKERAL
ncbi:MAG: methionine ABC transporter ATP-binding protein [Ancrocorticia sp.]|uniref:methionine ABC transporter ATP-binding protein n=1 Tax=Ancrocorticia sp. TaxID=2593684 RepID=UPI003F8F1047